MHSSDQAFHRRSCSNRSCGAPRAKNQVHQPYGVVAATYNQIIPVLAYPELRNSKCPDPNQPRNTTSRWPSAGLRDAFRMEVTRTERQSDATISLDGVRFELPGRNRHFRQVSVRYARWDLRRVYLVYPRIGTIFSARYPTRARCLTHHRWPAPQTPRFPTRTPDGTLLDKWGRMAVTRVRRAARASNDG